MKYKTIFFIILLSFIGFVVSSCQSETNYDSMFHDPEVHYQIMTQMMDNENWSHDYIDQMMKKDVTRQYLMKQMFEHVQRDSLMMIEMFDLMAQYPVMMNHIKNYIQSGDMMGNTMWEGRMMGRDKK